MAEQLGGRARRLRSGSRVQPAPGRWPVRAPRVRDASRAEQPSVAAEDGFGLDLQFRERVLPLFRFLYERYWRVEVFGAHNIPASGAALLVANHSGAIPFDGAMLVTAVRLADPPGRPVRFLYDRFVDNMPGVGSFYRRVGGAPASYANTARLVANGQVVLTFPEGIAGVAKPFRERYRLRQFSSSFIRLSLNHRVPIVPVAVVGAEEAYPLLARLEDAGKLLGVPYIPVTPLFPLLGVAGALPLPSKWLIRFGKPIELYRNSTRDDVLNPAVVPPRELAREVRGRIARMVRTLRQRRQSVFFG